MGGPRVYGNLHSTLETGGSDDTMSMDIDQLPLPLRLPFGDGLGCDPEAYTTDVDDDRPNGQHQDYEPFIAFPQRGECSFHRKLVAAYASGAAGVIVWGNDDSSILIRPSADPEWSRHHQSRLNRKGTRRVVRRLSLKTSPWCTFPAKPVY